MNHELRMFAQETNMPIHEKLFFFTSMLLLHALGDELREKSANTGRCR